MVGEVLDYFNQVGIPVMQWPSKGPDLNPIEHVFTSKKRIKINYLHINAVITAWKQIP